MPAGAEGHDRVDRLLAEPGALGEIAALVLAAGAEQQLHAFRAQPVELVDGAQHGEAAAGVLDAVEPHGLHHPVQHLAAVDFNHIIAALDAEPLQRVGGHHADFGVGGGRGGPNRIGVELHELAEASRSRLLVAIDLPDAIGAIRLWQRVEVLRDIAGQRRRQIVAQRQPLLVVVLKRKHALVGPVLIGQEFAERVGIFDRRRLQRLEAIKLIDGANRLQHFAGGGEFGAAAVGEAAGDAGFDFSLVLRRVLIVRHFFWASGLRPFP